MAGRPLAEVKSLRGKELSVFELMEKSGIGSNNPYLPLPISNFPDYFVLQERP